MNASIHHYLKDLLNINGALAKEVAAICKYIEYPSGSVISTHSIIDNKGMFLSEGVVKYIYAARSGSETIFRMSKAPSFMPHTLVGFFLKETSLTSCIALTDVKGYQLSSDQLFSLLDKNPELYEFYFSIALASHQLLQSKEINIIQNSSTERYTQFVKSFSDVIDDIPIKDIANYLNIQPGSLSRIRKKLNN